MSLFYVTLKLFFFKHKRRCLFFKKVSTINLEIIPASRIGKFFKEFNNRTKSYDQMNMKSFDH